VATAEKIAGAHYVILVADVYGKDVRPKNDAEAMAQVKQLYADRGTLRQRADKALQVLKMQAGKAPLDTTRIGAIGFCFGGATALELARSGADVAGVVSFHGTLPTSMPARKGAVKASLLVLNGADEAVQQRLHDYGLNLGYAFQIADDVLDYTSDAGTLGKNLGDDLAEGKATLPLIHAIGHSDAHVRDELRAAIEHGDTGALPQVLAAIHASGGLEYSRERARGYADLAERALDGLDDNDHLAALRGLAHYAVNRDH
jgi:hypothetical protein